MIAESKRLAKAAFATGQYQGEHQTFSSMAQLLSVFTPKRLELLSTLQQLGPSSVRGLARSAHRDVKRVHEDVVALIREGAIERTEDGKVFVPFEEIHLKATLLAKAA